MSNKSKRIETSFIQQGAKLYEQVGSLDMPDSDLYLQYDILSGTISTAEQVIEGETTYIPPRGELVAKGVILLPTYPEEYGSEKDLIQSIEGYIHKYVDVSETYRKIASYYVLLTWVYDCFETIPYLRLLGDFGTGKSRFQKVVGSICYKPMFTGGATTVSPIFRIIDLYKGTLILDEGDLKISDTTADLVKILNTGYSKGTPVLRTEGDKVRVPTSYNTYGPKIIGTRKRWTDKALESRCLTEVMRGSTRKDIPIHLPKTFQDEALQLRNQLLQFRFTHFGSVEVDYSLVIPHIEPRINQIVLALMSLIHDPEVQHEITSFVTEYAGQLKDSRSDELPAEVIVVMQEMVKSNEPLKTKIISERVNAKRDLIRGERPISPASIGRINASDFNFKTRKVNGTTEILWDAEIASSLFSRYGIETVDEVDDVDQVLELLVNPPSSTSLDKEPISTEHNLSTNSTKSTDGGGNEEN